MKYLNKLFAYDDRTSSRHHHHQRQPPLTPRLTSTLYSVTFVAESNQSSDFRTSSGGEEEEKKFNYKSGVTIVAHSASPGATGANCRFGCAYNDQRLNHAIRSNQSPTTTIKSEQSEHSLSSQKTITDPKKINEQTRQETSSLGGYLLTATIGKTIASTSALADSDTIADQLIEEDDWILIEDNYEPNVCCCNHNNKQLKPNTKQALTFKRLEQLQMALDNTDVELIRASWKPVLLDPGASGLLLFKGLFTKFPQYLKFFPQFADLDLERMQENKRLLNHAIRVIETVTFLTDSIGDESKTTILNDALVNLVKRHLQKRIGLAEFRNLGIVLIDFICDVNQRRAGNSLSSSAGKQGEQCNQLNKSSISDSSNHSSDDTETMTSALDKIRTSQSPSSSSEDESYLTTSGVLIGGNNSTTMPGSARNNLNSGNTDETTRKHSLADSTTDEPVRDVKKEAKLDTNALVAAWTKLYSSILELVKREEMEAQAS